VTADAPQPSAQDGAKGQPTGNQQLRIAILVVVAAIVGVGLWLALSHNSKHKPGNGGNNTTAIGPKSLTRSQLSAESGKLGVPIYWIGPKKGYRYEFSRTKKGYLFVRYLPKGVGVGRREGHLLIVGTYPWSHPYAALKKVSHGRVVSGPNGSIIIPARPGDAKNVLVAWPHGRYEVEVYEPKPGKASAIAGSGNLTPIG
jgi:hypothetical protein